VAEVRPFQGVRYDQNSVKDLPRVLCSPSDTLSPQKRSQLYRRDKHNFVRLDAACLWPTCLEPVDNSYEPTKWQKARVTMEDWLSRGILQVDQIPAIYLHNHYFTYRGKECLRRGIVAAVRLEEWGSRTIRRHEGILPELKQSRLCQVKYMKANTSPLYALFRDAGGRIYSLLSEGGLGEPIISVDCGADGRHRVWAITDSRLVEQICQELAAKPLYLADGHHRYEAALAFRDENRASNPAISQDAPFNYVMMELSSTADSGLIVYPFHRLIRGVPETVLSDLPGRFGSFFDVEEWAVDTPEAWQRVDGLLDGADRDSVVMALFGLTRDKLFVLRVGDFSAADRAMPDSRSEVYRRLDVSIADHIIVDKLLQVPDGEREKRLGFTNERADAVRRVLEGEYQMALLLRPTKTEQVINIADAGETMPEKSTCFYPKSPTGFVFYRFD